MGWYAGRARDRYPNRRQLGNATRCEATRPEARQPGELRGKIELRRIDVRYDNGAPLVLNNINLPIANSNKVASGDGRRRGGSCRQP
ncbi:hypothetical protein ACIA3K_17685 [Micromonospora sp. NPDC051543]|uniref:hypothetical protein n=1 Tax=Micromonospora sp. NPDC051543 TaxID=3364287 RepID=UPI003799D7A6